MPSIARMFGFDKVAVEAERIHNISHYRELVDKSLEVLQVERQSRIDDLKAQIESQHLEIQRLNGIIEALTDRLLLRNNVSPLKEDITTPAKNVPPEYGFTPWGMTPDLEDAFRQSRLDEEERWLMMTQGLDEESAKKQAKINLSLMDSPAGS